MRGLTIACCLLASPALLRAQPRDPAKLPDVAQPIFFSAYRAMEWLKLKNRPDGRFVYGFQPALRVALDGDNFLSQAGATFALARSSRYYRDERGATIARQAALALLNQETVLDKDGATRYTAAPPQGLDRLAAHGLLISAIHELATPGKELLEQADQLCNYLRTTQRPDGSLVVSEGSTLLKSGSEEHDAMQAGWALQAIIRSHKRQPAPWKLEMLKQARVHYMKQWEANKNSAMIHTHAPAYAEAFVLTKDAAYAGAVFTMNEWLIGLQYREEFDASRKHWTGGFPRYVNGKPQQTPPDIWSSLAAESLAEACRVAKLQGDLARAQRYERALLLNLRFVLSLQYTRYKTEHFAEKFRPEILGAFHASHQDGNVRLDYTQHPLCAMVQYLDVVIE
jgi:hypothetical protein